jgi:hypothetical protein
LAEDLFGDVRQQILADAEARFWFGEAQIMMGTHGELQFMDMVTIYGAIYI